jgi:hypothetical protein
MNILKTLTQATNEANTFQVYWTNSTNRLGGLIRVRVTANMQDAHIAAELTVMQHLLEECGVLGSHLVGNANAKLVVSLGAIKKLRRSQSDKSHLAPYASFLTTRFAGCPISVTRTHAGSMASHPTRSRICWLAVPGAKHSRLQGWGMSPSPSMYWTDSRTGSPRQTGADGLEEAERDSGRSNSTGSHPPRSLGWREVRPSRKARRTLFPECQAQPGAGDHGQPG